MSQNSGKNPLLDKIAVIIAAAGSSNRMSGVNKILAPLDQKPVLAYSLELFNNSAEVRQIIIAAPAGDLERIGEISAPFAKVKHLVSGGATRGESVYRASLMVDNSCEWVAVHDAARPLLTKTDWRSLLSALVPGCGAILGARPVDTVKQVKNGIVDRTLPRNDLVLAQTPQVCPRDIFTRLYQQECDSGFLATDEAMLMEGSGMDVAVVYADHNNIKITYPDDLLLAKQVLEMRKRG